MSGHVKVQVLIEETIEPQPVMNPNGYPVKLLGGGDRMSERQVLDRLSVTVTADTESEAIQRALDMLAAARA